eukprot:scaffold157101_cov31-Tisochrysis_lutea.AAC.2
MSRRLARGRSVKPRVAREDEQGVWSVTNVGPPTPTAQRSAMQRVKGKRCGPTNWGGNVDTNALSNKRCYKPHVPPLK